MDLRKKLGRQGPEENAGEQGDGARTRRTLEELLAGDSHGAQEDASGSGGPILTQYESMASSSIESLRMAYSKNPGNHGVGRILANLLYSSKDHAAALRILRTIVEAGVASGDDWYQYANCLAATRDWETACTAYLEALKSLKEPVRREKASSRLRYAQRAIQRASEE